MLWLLLSALFLLVVLAALCGRLGNWQALVALCRARRGSGTIAAGWWAWHSGLLSREASRVQWMDMHHQFGVLTVVCR